MSVMRKSSLRASPQARRPQRPAVQRRRSRADPSSQPGPPASREQPRDPSPHRRSRPTKASSTRPQHERPSPRSRQTDEHHDSTTTNPAGLRPAGFTHTYKPSSTNVTPSSSSDASAYTRLRPDPTSRHPCSTYRPANHAALSARRSHRYSPHHPSLARLRLERTARLPPFSLPWPCWVGLRQSAASPRLPTCVRSNGRPSREPFTFLDGGEVGTATPRCEGSAQLRDAPPEQIRGG